jgi:hypothetical protein
MNLLTDILNKVMETVYNMFEGMGQRPPGDPKAGCDHAMTLQYSYHKKWRDDSMVVEPTAIQ